MQKIIRTIVWLLTIVLTSNLGRIQFEGHVETFYNSKMSRVVAIAQDRGYVGEYWEREDDGCKMFGPYVICAGHKSRYGQVVNTSHGPGIILDTGVFVKSDPNAIDIATTW